MNYVISHFERNPDLLLHDLVTFLESLSDIRKLSETGVPLDDRREFLLSVDTLGKKSVESKVVPSETHVELAYSKESLKGSYVRDEGQVSDRQLSADKVILFRENRFENREDSLDLLGVTFDTVWDLRGRG